MTSVTRSVADALAEHVAASASPHIVVPVEVRSWLRRASSRSLIEELAVRSPQATFHGTPVEPVFTPIGPHFARTAVTSYVIAAAGALATLAIALLLALSPAPIISASCFFFP